MKDVLLNSFFIEELEQKEVIVKDMSRLAEITSKSVNVWRYYHTRRCKGIFRTVMGKVMSDYG